MSARALPLVAKGARLCALFCMLTGCAVREFNGHEVVYHFADWIAPIVIFSSLLLMALGWFLSKRMPQGGRIILAMFVFFAAFLLGIVAPMIYSDRVLLDNDHVEARYGFWFAPTVHNLRFADLREIRYVVYTDDQHRNYRELHCINRSGEETVIYAGDLVKNAVSEILQRAGASGVRIVDNSELK